MFIRHSLKGQSREKINSMSGIDRVDWRHRQFGVRAGVHGQYGADHCKAATVAKPFATTSPASATTSAVDGAGTMNEAIWYIVTGLMSIAALFAARHSWVVTLAIACPVAANFYVMRTHIELAVDHPARVIVPILSAVLGFSKLFAEASRGRRSSRPALLGLVVFVSGVLDVLALPASAKINEWIVSPLQYIACALLLGCSLLPEWRFRWFSSALA